MTETIDEKKPKIKFIKKGVESILYIGEYEHKECLIKERLLKKYRNPKADKNFIERSMRKEVSAFRRCQKFGILVPELYKVDYGERKLYMEYLDKSVSVKSYITDVIDKENALVVKEQQIEQLAYRIGTVLGTMHLNNLIHGDLTTTNMLINPKVKNDFTDYDLIMIDFGFGYVNKVLADRATDLYKLDRSLSILHGSIPHLFSLVYNAYLKIDTQRASNFIKCYEEVRKIGRERSMFGIGGCW